jgi:CubicO group peptidase (beta-lactamase class C family)
MTNKSSKYLLFSFICAVAVAAPNVSNFAHAESSPAILDMRRHFLDSDVSVLTYQTMNHIFETAPIKTGGKPWKLTSETVPLDFSYRFGGKDHKAGEFSARTFTNALLIVKNGKIVHESYHNFATASTRLLGMSMTKSFTSVLIGRALQDGLIHSVDDQIVAYVPELKGTAYEGVTIEQALRMRTGVDRSDHDQFKPGTRAGDLREKILVRNEMRGLDEAKLVKRKMPPGGPFEYSTLNTTVLGAVLEHATHQRFETYMSEKLWKPLGAQSDAYVIMDGPAPIGHALNGFGMSAVARDYARFGLMMLNGGRANGRQIISASWVGKSTVPGPGDEQVRPGAPLGYRYQWWTIYGSHAYMALGLDGQFIYIDPDTKTVIVKLSYFPRKPTENPEGESLAFFKAVSAWKPQGLPPGN